MTEHIVKDIDLRLLIGIIGSLVGIIGVVAGIISLFF